MFAAGCDHGRRAPPRTHSPARPAQTAGILPRSSVRGVLLRWPAACTGERPEENHMTKRFSMGLLAGVLALGAGCGGSGGSQDPNCGRDGFICQPSGFPFTVVALATSDLCGGPVAGCALAQNPP